MRNQTSVSHEHVYMHVYIHVYIPMYIYIYWRLGVWELVRPYREIDFGFGSCRACRACRACGRGEAKLRGSASAAMFLPKSGLTEAKCPVPCVSLPARPLCGRCPVPGARCAAGARCPVCSRCPVPGAQPVPGARCPVFKWKKFAALLAVRLWNRCEIGCEIDVKAWWNWMWNRCDLVVKSLWYWCEIVVRLDVRFMRNRCEIGCENDVKFDVKSMWPRCDIDVKLLSNRWDSRWDSCEVVVKSDVTQMWNWCEIVVKLDVKLMWKRGEIDVKSMWNRCEIVMRNPTPNLLITHRVVLSVYTHTSIMALVLSGKAYQCMIQTSDCIQQFMIMPWYTSAKSCMIAW